MTNATEMWYNMVMKWSIEVITPIIIIGTIITALLVKYPRLFVIPITLLIFYAIGKFAGKNFGNYNA